MNPFRDLVCGFALLRVPLRWPQITMGQVQEAMRKAELRETFEQALARETPFMDLFR